MRISVVVPAHQAEATLGETLASIAGQTRPPDEVVVVDDGSTDATAEVARASALAPEVIQQVNAGPAAAQNRGIAATTGELLAFLDADDLWTPQRLAVQQPFIEDGAEAVLGKVEVFRCPSLAPEVAARYAVPEEPQDAWLLGALLVRRDLLERVGRFDEELRMGHHIDWFDRARGQGVRFPIPDEVVLRRRVHPGSLSHRDVRKDGQYLEMARRALARRRAGASRTPPEPS